MNDRSKEKVMAFAVIGILAGVSIVALAVGLSLRKKGVGTNPVFAASTDQYLPKDLSIVPKGELPFSNPRTSVFTKDPDEKYALYFEWVRRNKWWHKKPSKQELAEAVSKGVSLGKGGSIWGTRDGKFIYQTREECPDLENAKFPGKTELHYWDYFHATLNEFRDPDKVHVIFEILVGVELAEKADGDKFRY